MGGHFATRFLDEDGAWMDHMGQFNSSADISPTGGQMPRLLGLAQASSFTARWMRSQSISRFYDWRDDCHRDHRRCEHIGGLVLKP